MRKLALLRPPGRMPARHSEADREESGLRQIGPARAQRRAHAQDLLAAFRLGCHQSCDADWDDMLHYCSLSACRWPSCLV